MITVEVIRPPLDSNFYIPPSRFLDIKADKKNPHWKPTVILSESFLDIISYHRKFANKSLNSWFDKVESEINKAKE